MRVIQVKNPKKIIIFIMILVVVAVGSVATALFLSHQSKELQDPKDNSPSVQAPGKLPAERKADNADKLAYEGDIDAGVEALDGAIRDTTDSYEQFIYYSRKATLLLNNNDVNGASDAAQKAYQLQKTADSAAFVGQIARRKGNNQEALTFYKRAVELIDVSSPMANSDKTYYQSIISELEGQAQ